MKQLKWIMPAILLCGFAVPPAFADYDYDDYLEDVRDAQRDAARSWRRHHRPYYTWRNHSVVVPRYRYYDYGYRTYPRYYYRDNGSLVGGILDWIF